jgi:hypothetical protein
LTITYPILHISDDETPRLPQESNDTPSKESLLALFSIGRRWAHKANDAQRDITALALTPFTSLSLQPQNLRQIHIFHNMLYESSGLRFLPPPTLQEWKSRLKNITMLTDPTISGNVSAPPVPDLDDFNLDIIGDVLVPMLTHSDTVLDLLERRFRVGQNPSGASLTFLVRETIPLKEKQRIVKEKVLSDVLICAAHPYNHSHVIKLSFI